MHEMCSMVETIASNLKKFETNFDRRMKAFEKVIQENDIKLGNKIKISEDELLREFDLIKKQ